MKALKRNNLFLIVLLFASLFSCRDKGIKNPNFEIFDNDKNGGILEVDKNGLWTLNGNSLTIRDFMGSNANVVSNNLMLNRQSFKVKDSFLYEYSNQNALQYLILDSNNQITLKLKETNLADLYQIDSLVASFHPNGGFNSIHTLKVLDKNRIFLNEFINANILNQKTLFYINRRTLSSINFNVYPPRITNGLLGYNFLVDQNLFNLNSKDNLLFLCVENQVILLRNNASVINELSRIL